MYVAQFFLCLDVFFTLNDSSLKNILKQFFSQSVCHHFCVYLIEKIAKFGQILLKISGKEYLNNFRLSTL